MSFREVPQQPNVCEILQSPEGIGVTEIGFKHYRASQSLYKSALPWDSEFGLEASPYVGYGLYCKNRMFHFNYVGVL